MRVLQLLSSSGFHGAETMTAELVRQLHAKGVNIDLGVFDNNGRSNKEILDVVAPYIQETIVIRCRRQFDWSAVSTLNKYLTARQPDLIHSHKYKTTFYALLARRHTPCRLVATYHNWLTDTWPLRFYAALDKRLARYCEAVVGVSEAVTQELQYHVPASKVRHIGNGIDTTIYHPPISRLDAKQTLGLTGMTLVGFVGRLSAEKGLSYLLRALTDLPASSAQPVHAVIVGDGEYRSALETEARALGLSERVHFLGNRRDTPMLYAAFDVFVLPSLREGFPMVLLEAMASGLPVIATRVGDVDRIVEQGVSGLVIEPLDSAALQRALQTLIGAPERAMHMGAAARERVERNFSSTKMAHEYLTLYEQVLRMTPK
jgi:glycosyltransferase involved in cell wall biosynthesis